MNLFGLSSSQSVFSRIICLYLILVPIEALAEWHGDIKLLSDYIYRGYSKSRGNPVVQAHIDYQNPAGWFAGLGVSQVRFDDQHNPDRAEIEIMPYVGWFFPVTNELRAELSIYGYIFDNKVFGQSANYAEFYVSLHYEDWLSLKASLAPDAYHRDVEVANYEVIYRRDLLDNVQFSAGLAYNQAGSLLDEDYFYWNAGFSWFVTSFLAVDFRYVDVALNAQDDAHNHQDEFYPRLQDNKYLFSLTVGF